MPNGRHAHVCENGPCGFIWWHVQGDHHCPRCGSGPYRFAYYTQENANEVLRLLRMACQRRGITRRPIQRN